MRIVARVMPFILIGAISACQAGQTPTKTLLSPPGIDLLDAQGDPEELFYSDSSLFEAGLIESERDVLDGWDEQTKYYIDIRISDDLTHVDGSQWLRFTNTEAVPLEEIYFRLFPNIMSGGMTVSQLTLNGDRVEPVFESANSAMRINLDEPLAQGESVEVLMDFSVSIPIEMGGNYGLFGYFEDILALQEFYPHIPVFDDEGWKIEVPPPNADVVYTDPSYYIVRISAPADQTLVFTGISIAHEINEDGQRLLIAAGPARDVYVASSNRFEKVSGEFDGVDVNSYAFKEDREGSEMVLENAISALETYTDRIGPYPYSEFDIVSTHMQALGMEYPGVIANSKAFYEPGGTLGDVPNQIYLDSVTAHEVAHQWFFSTVHSDQLDEPWLDEAMVQYATGLYYLDKYGQQGYEGFRDSWFGRWDRVDRADIPIGLPAGAYTGVEYGAIVYGRGPLFIEELAERMGAEAFDAFLQEYYAQYQWGIATGEGFKSLAEKHCECDLTSQFEEWVY